jgi:hypothetical protein
LNGNQVLAASIGFAHQLTLAIVGDCTAETLAKKVDGTVEPAGALLAHAIITEDYFIQTRLQGKDLLYRTGGFDAQLGIEVGEGPRLSTEWATTLKLDMATFTPYLQAVYAATDAYVSGLSDADLDREVDGPFGKQGVGAFIAGLVTFHLTEHLGEIAAIKGVQGLKGLPF